MNYLPHESFSRPDAPPTRLAMVVGIGGAGKSTIVKQFNDRSHVITVDQIQGAAGHRLAPFSKPKAVWEWEFWNGELKFSDVATAIRLEIESQFYRNLNDGRPIIAEGLILVVEPWKQAFIEALQQLGVNVATERFFWLDPSPQVLLKHILSRGRPHELHKDLENVTNLRSWYAQKCDHLQDFRYEESDRMEAAMNDFIEQLSNSVAA